MKMHTQCQHLKVNCLGNCDVVIIDFPTVVTLKAH